MNANKIYFGLIDVWKIILKETILENGNFWIFVDKQSIQFRYSVKHVDKGKTKPIISWVANVLIL